MTFVKAILASVLFASVSASAATFNCKAISSSIGGNVQLVTDDGVSFLLIKNNVTVGRLDFQAPPTTVERENLSGQAVPFLRFYDSITSPSVVVTSLLFVEQSLLNRTTNSGLVVLQQQNSQQFLCRPATN